MKPQDQPESNKPLPYEPVIRYHCVRAPLVPHLNAWQVYLSVNGRSLDVGPTWDTEEGAQRFSRLVSYFLQEIEPKGHAALRDWISQIEVANNNLASERDATRLERDAMALARDVARHNLGVARARAQRVEEDNALIAAERDELRKSNLRLREECQELRKSNLILTSRLDSVLVKDIAQHNLSAARTRIEQLEKDNKFLTAEQEKLRRECERLRARLRKVAEYLTRESKL